MSHTQNEARRYAAMSRKSLARAAALLRDGSELGLAVDALNRAASWAKLAAGAVQR